MGLLAGRPWEAWCAAALCTLGLTAAAACVINPQPLPPDERGGDVPTADSGVYWPPDGGFGTDAASDSSVVRDARSDAPHDDAASDAAHDAALDSGEDAMQDACDEDAPPDAYGDEDGSDGGDTL